MRKDILRLIGLTLLDQACASAWMDMMDQASPEQRAKADKRFQEGLKEGIESRKRFKFHRITEEGELELFIGGEWMNHATWRAKTLAIGKRQWRQE